MSRDTLEAPGEGAWVRVGTLLLVCAVLGGCGGIVRGTGLSVKSVGEEGGVVSLDGFEVDVPAGSIAGEATFELETYEETPAGNVGPAYRLEMTDGELTGPVTIRLHVPRSLVPEGRYDDLRLARMDGTHWEIVPGSRAIEEDEIVEGEVTEAGVYGAVLCTTNCDGHSCGGDDGCGEQCDKCEDGFECGGGQCQPVCGDGQCLAVEDCDSCPDDCGDCCGDGECAAGTGEDLCNCPEDCGDPCAGGFCGDDGCGGTCTCADGFTCDSGSSLCTRQPLPGEIVVSEFLTNGSAACADKGDWFELLNASPDHLQLMGCRFKDGVNEYKIPTSNVLPAGGLIVFVQSAQNPGFQAENAYFYGSVPNFNKMADVITLECGSLEIFSIQFGSNGDVGAPTTHNIDATRVAMQLSLGEGQVPTADYALDACNWCPAETLMECGDYGTPGAPNVACICVPDCSGKECGSDGCCGTCGGDCDTGLECVEGVGLCARWPEPGEIIATEFLTNSSQECGGGKDWTELVSLAADRLALMECTLADTTTESVIEDPVVMEPGEYLVLFQANYKPDFGEVNAYPYGDAPNLDTSKPDEMSLTCGGEEIFKFAYDSDPESGLLPAPEGDALRTAVQLSMPPGVDLSAGYADNVDNWCLAQDPMECGDIGTPGLPNTECP